MLKNKKVTSYKLDEGKNYLCFMYFGISCVLILLATKPVLDKYSSCNEWVSDKMAYEKQ